MPRNTTITPHWKYKSLRDIRLYCSEIVADIQLLHFSIKYDKNRALKRNYFILRYEDLAKKPFAKASEIYQFMGMKLPNKVNYWIHTSTRSGGVHSALSTKRISADTYQNWRLHLSFPLIEAIQNECKEAMEFMGYIPAVSDEQVLSINTSLLAKLPTFPEYYDTYKLENNTYS